MISQAVLLSLLVLATATNLQTRSAYLNAPFIDFRTFNKRTRRWRRFNRICGAGSGRFRKPDGSCNHLRRKQLGAADTPFLLLSQRIGPGPSGSDRPNARIISNSVHAETRVIPNRRHMSEMVTFFGQFLDHTIAETENEKNAYGIDIPKDDPVFTDGGTITLFRTRKTMTRRGLAPVNLLTSFIDAAAIYGAHKPANDKLRTFKNGLLRTTKEKLLPRDERGFFISGDNRVNENPMLSALHTLFMREHNRLCGEIRKARPWWNDEKIYEMARKIVGALQQSIVYYEFLPTVLGKTIPYKGPWAGVGGVNPQLSDEFSTVAYRVGHSLINRHMTFISKTGIRSTTLLRNVFFRPNVLRNRGMEAVLRGAISTRASEIDTMITDEVRNFLLGGPRSAVHLDLAALNIQRGRDHQVPTYVAMRRLYGFHRPITRFSQITRNTGVANALKRVYGTVNRVDAWSGGLAEDHVQGGSLGPLFRRMWIREFQRLRRGDRFYFEKWGFERPDFVQKIPTLRKLLRGKLKGSTLSFILEKNTELRRNEVRNPWKAR